MKRAVVGYVRVSSESQKEGISVTMQMARIRDYAQTKGLFLAGIYGDPGISAKSVEGRPGLQTILALAVDRRIAGLVVYKIDRVFRNTIEGLQTLEQLKRLGVEMHIVDEGAAVQTTTANDELMTTLKLSLATWERRVIGERTKAALRQKRVEGFYLGQVPFGFRLVSGRLEPDDQEQAIIKIIRSLKQSGMSYRRIALELNRGGYTTKRGASWGPSQVLRTYREAA